MKISPMSASGQTVGAVDIGGAPAQTIAQKIRSLKMSTNATPGRTEEPLAPPALAISDVNNDPVKETPEATEPLSPQFAALAKQRRALQVKEREIADREKALLEKAPLQGDVVDKARLKSDPLGVMLESGVTYEQLTEAVLANQNGYNPEIQALKAEIKALKEGVDKTLTERDTKAEQGALAEMRKEAVLLSAQGEEFELVRATGSIPQVMGLIEQTYRKTGEVLDVREALGLVEGELINDVMKLAPLKKVQSQFAPAQPALPQQQQQRQMRTLTNRDTASVPLSRKARALAAFTGTLKK